MTALDSAADYHRRTAYGRKTMSGGGMDWSNRPELYKNYPGAESVALPRELDLPRRPAWTALAGGGGADAADLDLGRLAKLLFMAYGFTQKVDYGSEVFLYRSAPSAGALYPVDLYLCARDIEGLDDGLYHYSIIDFALTRLRSGPPPAVLPAPALILTGLYFRSAWKYRQRAYRYCLLDAGHAAENLLLSGGALGLPLELTAEFDDEAVNQYLGLDPAKESALAVVKLGAAAAEPGGPARDDGPLPTAEPAAGREEVFDLIVEAARLTSTPLKSQPQGLGLWPGATQVKLPAPAWEGFEGPSLVGALQQRRSRRNYRPQSLTTRDLARVLELVLTSDVGRVVDAGVLVNEIIDLGDGFYQCRPGETSIWKRKPGFLSPALADAALGQDWVGRATINFIISAPLDRLEEDLGPRGLRLAYLAAGRIGQRAYLTAETMGWGCCGVGAFYDDEVSRLLGLPEGEEPLYVLPVGPIKKRTHGGRPTPR